jgi:glycosyltransferase involved in cell wall biosynthesis
MGDLLAGKSVAVVHEWFSAVGGSERVFLALADLVPHADRYVLWVEPDADVRGLGLRQTWLAHTPLRRSKVLALPIMPFVWRTVGRPAPDVVISSSHAFAHTVKLGDPAHTRHLSYVHLPARYVWTPHVDHRGTGPIFAAPRRLLQAADRRGGRHVHAYAAASHDVRRRINRFWRRDAVVINPPVDTDFFTPVSEPSRDYLLGVGRWVPYKNFDLMIDVAQAAKMPLVLAGTGPEETRLRRRAAAAGVPVTFVTRPDPDRLRSLYGNATALLYPAHEDFGITPVEAQACGTPVLGLRRGGLLETVMDAETGFLADALNPDAYVPLIRRAGALASGRIRRHAEQFSYARFAERVTRWVDDATR